MPWGPIQTKKTFPFLSLYVLTYCSFSSKLLHEVVPAADKIVVWRIKHKKIVMNLQSFRVASNFRQFLAALLVLVAVSAGRYEAKCAFKAIFNFGDSNTDTGGLPAAFPALPPPFGMTYFKRPAGRASDGRLVLDFLAQALGKPFLSPYLQSIGSNFQHGANFATSASTVLLPKTSLFVSGISPFALPIQINQMKQLKSSVDELHSKGQHLKGGTKLPRHSVFGNSLYTIYIGQNDFTSNIAEFYTGGLQKIILPQVIHQIASSIEELYALGGRTFMVLNLAPVGCYPVLLAQIPHNSSGVDEYGCLIAFNNAVVDYNNMLKKALTQTRQHLPDASVIYVDTHATLLELFRHPKSHGLLYSTKACCGYGGGAYNFDPRILCGNNKVIDGQNVTAKACHDPYNYVSFDGIHATEAANKHVAYAILNGSYFDPPFPLHQLCDIQPIG